MPAKVSKAIGGIFISVTLRPERCLYAAIFTKTSGIDNGAYPKDNITTHYAEVTPFAGNMKFYQTIDEYN